MSSKIGWQDGPSSLMTTANQTCPCICSLQNIYLNKIVAIDGSTHETVKYLIYTLMLGYTNAKNWHLQLSGEKHQRFPHSNFYYSIPGGKVPENDNCTMTFCRMECSF